MDTLENTVTVNSSVFSEWMLADDVSGLRIDESENNKIMINKLAAYPNPFREKTVIRYSLTVNSKDNLRPTPYEFMISPVD